MSALKSCEKNYIECQSTDIDFDLISVGFDNIENYSIFHLDRDGLIKTWNLGAKLILGFTKKDIIGKPYSTLFSSEDNFKLRPQFEIQLTKECGRYESEVWRMRKDGSHFLAEVTISVLKNKSGELLGFALVTKDLSLTKKAKEKKIYSDDKFRLLINSINDYAIFMIDQNGLIKSWSKGSEKILGFSEDSVLDHNFEITYPIEDIVSGKPLLNLQTARGPLQKMEENAWRVNKDGFAFWANVIYSPLSDEEGNNIGFVCVIRDLTSTQKIHELEDSIKMRDEFITLASHELRTPLTRLLLNLQMTKRHQVNLNERMLKSLRDCEKYAKELAGIIESLMDVTKLRLGKLDIRRTKTNISKILLNVVDKFKDEIRLAGNRVQINYDKDLIGYWDQVRLDQLISNLLSNAIKFGNGRPIHINLKKVDYHILFTIEDEGLGIPYQLQPKIFERFERAIDAHKISGLGLGLYICKQIVRAHNGEINLESHPGKGTTLKFYLPINQTLFK